MYPKLDFPDKWKNSEIDGVDFNLVNFPYIFRCSYCASPMKTEELTISYDINNRHEMTGTIFPCDNQDCQIIEALQFGHEIDHQSRRDKFYLPKQWRGIKIKFTALMDYNDLPIVDLKVIEHAH